MATTSRAKARRAARAAQRAAQSDPERENNRVLARNRRATWQYEITQRIEAGIELRGSEIKSLRMGRGSIAEAYCRPRGGQLWLIGAHIARYEPAGEQNHELTRDRRLLVHRREIHQLEAAFEQRRLTLVPLRLYLKHGLVKLEIGVGRGKREHEKRERIRERETNREIARVLRQNNV